MKKHYRTENDCLNCGATLQGPFCHMCGQENLQIKESFGQMMNHAISDYFHFDHKFFHTLKPLFFKPGMLTNEYMAGRRTQYLHPVKMYIFISIVYFLLLFQNGNQEVKANNQAKPADTHKVADSINKINSKKPAINAAQQKQAIKYQYYGKNYAKSKNTNLINYSGDTTYKQYLASQSKLPLDKRDGFFIRKMSEKFLKYREKYGSRTNEVFVEQLQHNAPKMMFVLLPILALIISIAFRKNKKYYVEHLIFSFQLYCFLFLFLGIIMLLEMVIPDSWGLSPWLTFFAVVYILWYIYRSLRVVYNRSRFRTISKTIGMSVTYSAAAIVCFMLLVGITAITAT